LRVKRRPQVPCVEAHSRRQASAEAMFCGRQGQMEQRVPRER
jgi:hypothetical protein